MRSLVFNLFFYGFTFVIALICYVLARVSTRERMLALIGFWGRCVMAAVRLILGARIEIRGRGNLPPGGPGLVVSKHQSELDIVVMMALYPEAGAVAMQELERYPFFGTILRKMELVVVAVDSGSQGRTEQAVAGALKVKAQGRPMFIYPEATLMSLGARERYRRGVGHIYQAMGVEATPVAASLGVIWPRREWKKHAGRTGAIEFLPPVPPGLDFETFMTEIETRIETATMRLIREHASGEVLAAAEDRHARGAANED